MSPNLISPQEANRITSENQIFSINSKRKNLIENLAGYVSQQIFTNAQLGFQHTFIDFDDYHLVERLHKYYGQIQDIYQLITMAVKYLNEQTNDSSFVYRLIDAKKVVNNSYNENHGVFIVWEHINDQGLPNHENDLNEID